MASALPAPPAEAPPLSWRVLLGVPVVTVLVTGFAVHLGLGLVLDEPWRWSALGGSLLRAALYVSVMWPGTVAVFRWTVRHWPLRGAGDVARHAGALVLASVVLFVAASGLVRLLLGDVTPWRVFAVIITVSAVATGGLATVLYGLLAAQRLRAARDAALEAELRALRAQINPHFLFNALNTIAALVRIRPADAERVTEDLADLFRYSLAASDRAAVPLAEEVASVQTYLAIERARFGDALGVEIDVPESLRGRPVPSLILQPLVENAVTHGLRAAGGGGTVTVRARGEAAGPLALDVLDTGPGFGTEAIADVLGRGTGLTNVHERLRAALGPEAGLRLVPGGVRAHLPAP